MTTDITPFNYADHQVRVITIDGEPWFVLTDETIATIRGGIEDGVA